MVYWVKDGDIRLNDQLPTITEAEEKTSDDPLNSGSQFKYEFAKLSALEYQLEVIAAGYATVEEMVNVGFETDESVVIDLHAVENPITYTVVDQSGADVGDGSWVEVNGVFAETDDDGEVEFSLEDGEYEFKVYVDGNIVKEETITIDENVASKQILQVREY